MNILTPINNVNDIKDVINAGANELYCGVLSNDWKEKYTNVGSMNRREFKTSNLRSFKELKKCVKISHDFNTPIFLTMNAFYTKKQYTLLKKEVEEVLSSEVDALIVADLGLISYLNDFDVKLHISNCGSNFNSNTISFYRKNKGTRIILDRHLTLNEIKKITKHGLELETFAMNTRCINLDGFCTFQHGINEVKNPILGNLFKKLKMDYAFEKILKKTKNKKKVNWNLLGSTSACCLNYSVDGANNNINNKIKHHLGPINLLNHCGACALFDFNNANITSLKIVGRQNPLKKKKKDTQFLKILVDYLKETPSKKDFFKKAKEEYYNFYKLNCNLNYCYYPY